MTDLERLKKNAKSMTMAELLWRGRELQVAAYGADPQTLEGKGWAEYVRYNVLCLTDEAHEFLRLSRWKPWKLDQGPPAPKDRAEALDEIVDVLFFWSNLVLALGVDPHEVEQAYLDKWHVNLERSKEWKPVAVFPDLELKPQKRRAVVAATF